MVNLKIKQAFNDENTGFRYQEGVFLEVDDARFKEMDGRAKAQGLKLTDFVEKVKEEITPSK